MANGREWIHANVRGTTASSKCAQILEKYSTELSYRSGQITKQNCGVPLSTVTNGKGNVLGHDMCPPHLRVFAITKIFFSPQGEGDGHPQYPFA